MSSILRGRIALGAGALILAAAGACFSEKDPAASSGDGVDCGVPLSRVPAGHVIVALRNLAFVPDSIEITSGTTVTWVNCDDPGGAASMVDHTVTSDDGVWTSSPLFSPGETFTVTFDQVGLFPYHCIPHRAVGMIGRVVVQ